MSEFLFKTELDRETAVLDEWFRQLTIAHGLMGLILLFTAVFRFTNLTAIPLSPAEAEAAWGVWQYWQPASNTIVIPSPAYFTLTGLFSQVVGFSDATMRLIPALFGLGLVYLPWLLRERIGTTGALVTSLLFAFSPIQTIVARTAGGDVIALFAILLLLIAVFRYQENEANVWLYTSGVALALGLTSSPLFYSGLVTVYLAWVVQRFLGPALFMGEIKWGEFNERVTTAVLIATLFILLSTLSLLHLWGFGSAVSLPITWFGRFAAQAAGTESALDPFLAIGRYEPMLVLLGLVAIAWVAFHDESLANFCVYWMVAVFILILFQQGEMGNAALATIPGYLMLGILVNTLLNNRPHSLAWVLGGGLFLLGLMGMLHTGRFLRLVIYDPEDLSHLWVAFLAFTFALTSIYFVATWNWQAAYQGTLIGVLAFCLYYQWGTGWWLAQQAANDPRERWATTATADDVPVMVDMLQEISEQVTGSDRELEILSTVDSPVLGWYLRDFRQVQFTEVLPSPVQTAVVISPVEQTDLTLNSDYVGTDFALVKTGLQPQEASPTLWLDTLRWWLFQESSAVPLEERAIIWLRADLIQQK